MKYKKEFTYHFSKRKVFSLKDVRIFFKNKNISKDYSKNMLSNLNKKKEIIRISSGKYTFKKDIVNIGFAFSPFYYGLQDALSYHNLHTQETNPIIITQNKIKPGVRSISGTNVYLRRISRKYFFGFDFIKYYDIEIPVSDIEKTLIDLVYYRQDISKEIIDNSKDKIDLKKLNEYLFKYPPFIKKKLFTLFNF
jgi:predicted transcriptional regulator of viral defense system